MAEKKTTSTIDVKQTINTEAKNATNFVANVFIKPVDAIKEVASTKSNKHFITALIIFLVWFLTSVIVISIDIIHSWKYMTVFVGFKMFMQAILAPVITVATFTLLLYFFPKFRKDKISFTQVLTASIIPIVPLAIAKLFNMLVALLSTIPFLRASMSKSYFITSPINSFLSVIGIVLSYFVVKYVSGEEDDSKLIKKFIILQAIYFAVCFICSLAGVSLSTL